MSCRAAFLLLVTGLTSAAAAQTTRPAPPAWDQTVRAFAHAVIMADADAAGALLADHAAIRPFSSREMTDVARLIESTGGRLTLGTHAYLFPPTALAADLSSDVAAAGVPDAVKQAMVLDDVDETARQRASATGVRWVKQALSAAADEPVALVILWPSDPASGGVAASAARPSFVLLKGAASPGGKFLITTAVYGDPLRN